MLELKCGVLDSRFASEFLSNFINNYAAKSPCRITQKGAVIYVDAVQCTIVHMYPVHNSSNKQRH